MAKNFEDLSEQEILALAISLIPFANRDPSILAGGNAWALVRFLEPRNDAGRLRPVTIG